MLSAALTAALLLAQDTELVSNRLEVGNPEGWCEVWSIQPDGGPIVIPRTTFYEVVPRSPATSRGHRFRLQLLEEPDVQVTVIEHPDTHQVFHRGKDLLLLGPTLLPRDVVPGEGEPEQRSALPWIARQDGMAIKGELEVEFAETNAELLVVITTERVIQSSHSWRLAPSLDGAAGGGGGGGFRSATHSSLERPSPASPRTCETFKLPERAIGMRLDLHTSPVDQIFLANSLPVVESEPLKFERAARGEFRVASQPTPQEGLTQTFIVRLLSGPSRVDVPVEPEPAASPAPLFVERSAFTGLEAMHLEGAEDQLDIRPTMGSGVAIGDLNDDGWLDVYVVQGSGREGSAAPTNRTFLNVSVTRSKLVGEQASVSDLEADTWEEGRGFADATDRVGGADPGAGMGALLFDATGNGALDLYVANRGADTFWHGTRVEGLPRLEDVSAAAGVGGDLWSAGIAASDPDRDGDLDLYVTSYLVYDESLMPPANELLLRREDPIPMLPFAFPGQRNTYLRNDSAVGVPHFTDVTEEAGLLDEQGRGMQPVFWDFDDDGDDDLYVANDVSMNVLFENDGAGAFRDISFRAGLDDPRGGMGLALGDVDSDGDEDLFLTNWELETNALYLNNVVKNRSDRRRIASFSDVTPKSGMAPWGVGYTSWGAELSDFDLDGHLDLVIANGYTSPDYESTGICVGQPNHLFLGDGEGHFEAAHELGGSGFSEHLASRSVVSFDYDRDGDLDLLFTANNGPLRLLENTNATDRAWLTVRLEGARFDAGTVGAKVELQLGEQTFRRTLRAGSSYLVGNPAELHFGLGELEGPGTLTVRWPDGEQTQVEVRSLSRVVDVPRPR